MDKENLTSNKETKQQQSNVQKAASSIQGGLVCGVIFTLFTYIVYDNIFDFTIGQILTYFMGIFAFICYMVSVCSFFDWKKARKIEKIEEEARKEEKEFSEIEPSKRALRAEKLFRLNQKELMRYYDMNLAQTKFLSGLGIVMIVLGILIIVISLLIYAFLDTEKIFLIVGNVSGIIVDFVGAIFIRMYTQNIEAAVKFHAKFADSNNLLLANSIANKIESEKLREETLSEIAKEIIQMK